MYGVNPVASRQGASSGSGRRRARKVWAGSLSRLKVRAVPHDEKCAVQNSSHRTKLRRRKRFLGAMLKVAKCLVI